MKSKTKKIILSEKGMKKLKRMKEKGLKKIEKQKEKSLERRRAKNSMRK